MAIVAKLLVFTAFAWLVTTTGFVQIVNPPRGDVVMTADQQAAFNHQSALDQQRAFDATVVSYLSWHHCLSVTQWKAAHPKVIPATMVQHADGSARIEQVRWTYPAGKGEWVVGFCG